MAGGGGGIRTHETLSGLTVFKTAGVNRFPTPPIPSILAFTGRIVISQFAAMWIFVCIA